MAEEILGLQINTKDNVAVVFGNVRGGMSIYINKAAGKREEYIACNDIGYGHKIALRDIKCGEDIIKYGEIIGRATADIQKGAHVHTENVESLRGRGDLQ